MKKHDKYNVEIDPKIAEISLNYLSIKPSRLLRIKKLNLNQKKNMNKINNNDTKKTESLAKNLSQYGFPVKIDSPRKSWQSSMPNFANVAKILI